MVALFTVTEEDEVRILYLGPTYNGVNVKVLIYSSKEIYEKSSYAGRAEAHLIAYAVPGLTGNKYVIVKDRHEIFYSLEINFARPKWGWELQRHIDKYERDHDDSPCIPELTQ